MIARRQRSVRPDFDFLMIVAQAPKWEVSS
jgi:hypothetical protein